MTITNKGIIFSIDALIAFIIVLFMIMVFVIYIENQSEKITQNLGQFFLEEKLLLVADSLVKNYNSENVLLGACAYDIGKKRVKTNEISTINFEQIKLLRQDNFFVKSVSFETETRSEKWLVENKAGICLTTKRFVLIDGEKGLIFVEGCINE